MILDLMRKHRRASMWVLLVCLIGPFVLWGGYSSLASNRNQGALLDLSPVAAVAGAPIAPQAFSEEMNKALNQIRRSNEEVKMEDLVADGTADKVIESLANQTLVQIEAEKTGLVFEKEFLVAQLQKSQQFQRDGQFDPKIWNDYVRSGRRRHWDAEYGSIAASLKQGVAVREMSMSARVPESTVRETFEQQNTSVKLRYVSIEPAVTPTEEQIKKQYDDNPTNYQNPEQYRARFAAIALRAPKPVLADEILQKARAGEDFQALAKAHSEDLLKEKGGDKGWWDPNAPGVPEYLLPVLALPVGAVSDVVDGPGGAYCIFKIAEERVDSTTQVREVHVYQIQLMPKLTDEEKAAREQQAKDLAANAAELKDINAAAAALSLITAETDMFSRESFRIANVAAEDAYPFRTGIEKVVLNGVSEVITGSANLYVAQLIEVKAAELKPFEEVRDQVVEDATAAIKRSPEHIEKTRVLAEGIAAKAKSLEQVVTEGGVDVTPSKETQDFTLAEYKFGMGPMWNMQAVMEDLKGKEAGAFLGPVYDYLGVPFFVELVSKTAPDETAWKDKWEEQSKPIRERLLQMAENKRVMDYLRERRLTGNFSKNQQAINEVLFGKEDPELMDEEVEEAETAVDSTAVDSATEEEAVPDTDAAPAVEAAPLATETAPDADVPVSAPTDAHALEVAPAPETVPAQ